MAPTTSARLDVLLRPAAHARAWMGLGRAQETIAVPGVVLAPGEALVRVDLVTISEDDVAVAAGAAPCPVPTVLGSEFVGRIAALGGSVAAVDGGELALGERVVCGRRARERIGGHRELVGGFASHVHVPAGAPIARVGEALPACILAPTSGAVAEAAMLLRVIERDVDLDRARIRVEGDGVAALALAAMTHSRGARATLDSSDARIRSWAPRFGADRGRATSSERGLRVTVAFGTRAPRTVVASDVVVPCADDLRAAVDFIRRPATRRYPFAELVARPVPLDQLDSAISAARSREHLRIAIAPGL